MDNVTLTPAELGAVAFVVALALVLVWRVYAKAMDTAFSEKAPHVAALRELAAEVHDLRVAIAPLHTELVEARRERGDPTPVTPPRGTYAVHRSRTPPRGTGGGGG